MGTERRRRGDGWGWEGGEGMDFPAWSLLLNPLKMRAMEGCSLLLEGHGRCGKVGRKEFSRGYFGDFKNNKGWRTGRAADLAREAALGARRRRKGGRPRGWTGRTGAGRGGDERARP